MCMDMNVWLFPAISHIKIGFTIQFDSQPFINGWSSASRCQSLLVKLLHEESQSSSKETAVDGKKNPKQPPGMYKTS